MRTGDPPGAGFTGASAISTAADVSSARAGARPATGTTVAAASARTGARGATSGTTCVAPATVDTGVIASAAGGAAWATARTAAAGPAADISAASGTDGAAAGAAAIVLAAGGATRATARTAAARPTAVVSAMTSQEAATDAVRFWRARDSRTDARLGGRLAAAACCFRRPGVGRDGGASGADSVHTRRPFRTSDTGAPPRTLTEPDDFLRGMVPLWTSGCWVVVEEIATRYATWAMGHDGNEVTRRVSQSSSGDAAVEIAGTPPPPVSTARLKGQDWTPSIVTRYVKRPLRYHIRPEACPPHPMTFGGGNPKMHQCPLPAKGARTSGGPAIFNACLASPLCDTPTLRPRTS